MPARHFSSLISLLLCCYFFSTSAYSMASITFKNSTAWSIFGYQLIYVKYTTDLDTDKEKHFYWIFYPKDDGSNTCKIWCVNQNLFGTNISCETFRKSINIEPLIDSCRIKNGGIIWDIYNIIRAQGNSVTQYV